MFKSDSPQRSKQKKNKPSKAKSKFLPLTEKKHKESSSFKKETQIQDSSTYSPPKNPSPWRGKTGGGYVTWRQAGGRDRDWQSRQQAKNRRECYSGQTNILAKGSGESRGGFLEGRCEQLWSIDWLRWGSADWLGSASAVMVPLWENGKSSDRQ